MSARANHAFTCKAVGHTHIRRHTGTAVCKTIVRVVHKDPVASRPGLLVRHEPAVASVFQPKAAVQARSKTLYGDILERDMSSKPTNIKMLDIDINASSRRRPS